MQIIKQQVKEWETQTWKKLSNVKAGLIKMRFLSIYCFFAVNIEYVIKH